MKTKQGASMLQVPKRNIVSNFMYQYLYQIVSIIVPLVTFPYISRVVGAEGIGEYTYTYTVVYYFVCSACAQSIG